MNTGTVGPAAATTSGRTTSKETSGSKMCRAPRILQTKLRKSGANRHAGSNARARINLQMGHTLRKCRLEGGVVDRKP